MAPDLDQPTADLAQCQREIELVAESNARLHDALQQGGVPHLARTAQDLESVRSALRAGDQVFQLLPQRSPHHQHALPDQSA